MNSDEIKCDVAKIITNNNIIMSAIESDQLTEKQLVDVIINSSGFIEYYTNNAVIMVSIFDTECAAMLRYLKDQTEKIIALSQEKLASKQRLTS